MSLLNTEHVQARLVIGLPSVFNKLKPGLHCAIFKKSFRIVLVRLYEHDDHVTLCIVYAALHTHMKTAAQPVFI